MIFEFDPDKVSDNARHATTTDLLERVTLYRTGMEPRALAIIEAELQRRGVGPTEIHLRRTQSEQKLLFDNDGLPLTCSFCNAPAVVQNRGWQCLWGKVPLFPRLIRYCQTHRLTEPMR